MQEGIHMQHSVIGKRGTFVKELLKIKLVDKFECCLYCSMCRNLIIQNLMCIIVLKCQKKQLTFQATVSTVARHKKLWMIGIG